MARFRPIVVSLVGGTVFVSGFLLFALLAGPALSGRASIFGLAFVVFALMLCAFLAVTASQLLYSLSDSSTDGDAGEGLRATPTLRTRAVWLQPNNHYRGTGFEDPKGPLSALPF